MGIMGLYGVNGRNNWGDLWGFRVCRVFFIDIGYDRGFFCWYWVFCSCDLRLVIL